MSNGNSGDMEAMKQEILREMRKEIGKAKQEIIDGEFNLIENKQNLRTFIFSHPGRVSEEVTQRPRERAWLTQHRSWELGALDSTLDLGP